MFNPFKKLKGGVGMARMMAKKEEEAINEEINVTPSTEVKERQVIVTEFEIIIRYLEHLEEKIIKGFEQCGVDFKKQD